MTRTKILWLLSKTETQTLHIVILMMHEVAIWIEQKQKKKGVKTKIISSLTKPLALSNRK